MDEDQAGDGSLRRALIKRRVDLGMGVAVVAVSNRALSRPARISEESAGDLRDGKMPDQDRDYDSSDDVTVASDGESATGLLVEGPIKLHGHRRAFMPATRK